MLEIGYDDRLSDIQDGLPCEVVLPEWWKNIEKGKASAPIMESDLRRFLRLGAPGVAVCELLCNLPAIQRATAFMKVYTKDISRGGIGFFTSLQLYPGEDLIMWTRAGKLSYSVARCRKHGDRCFEVGAKVIRTLI